MKLGIDQILGALAIATAGGGALALSAHSDASNARETTQFTQADEAVFARNFKIGDSECDVGFAGRDHCFDASPLEGRVVEGEKFPDNMYPLALEWRAELAMTKKDSAFKTVRVGQTIALMERDSRKVVDVMRLGETSFAGDTTPTAG